VSYLDTNPANRDTVNDARDIQLIVGLVPLVNSDINGHTTAGQSIMATKSELAFWIFVVGNSIGFYTSLNMVIMLTVGFP